MAGSPTTKRNGAAFKPGQRVAVTQQIAQRDDVWTTRVEGTVVRFERKKTGSWYAHAKDDKLWLDRLVLCKDDGEIVVCHLDPYTHVDVLAAAKQDAPAASEDAKPQAAAEQEAGAES